MFEKLVWQSDRLLCNGLVFRLQHYKSDDWELGDACFVFYKIKELVDQYEHFFASRQFPCQRVLELGMWEGGSLAFWYETFRPDKIIGIDLSDRSDSQYFQQYIDDNGLQERVKTYWRVNQADVPRIKEIVSSEFDGPLDLVVDDASHVYGPTLASFQALFPLVRPGGFYVIEDWAWEHWPDYYQSDTTRANDEGPSDLVWQLVQAAGTSDKLIKSVAIYQGFAAIQRSDAIVPDNFELKNYVIRRPQPTAHRSPVDRIKQAIHKVF